MYGKRFSNTDHANLIESDAWRIRVEDDCPTLPTLPRVLIQRSALRAFTGNKTLTNQEASAARASSSMASIFGDDNSFNRLRMSLAASISQERSFRSSRGTGDITALKIRRHRLSSIMSQ